MFPGRHLLLPPIDLPGDLLGLLVNAELSTGTSRNVSGAHTNYQEGDVDELADEEDDGVWGNQLLEYYDSWHD